MVVSVEGCLAGARDGCGRRVSVDRATCDWPTGQLLFVLLATCRAGLARDACRTSGEFALDTGLFEHALHNR